MVDMKKPEYTYWPALILFLMSLILQYLTANRRMCLYIIIAFSALSLFLSFWKKTEDSRIQNVRMIIPCVLIILSLLDLFIHHEILFFLVHFCAFVYGLFENVLYLLQTKDIWKRAFPIEHFKYVIRAVLILLVCIAWIILNILRISPEIMVKGSLNQTEYPAVTETVFLDTYAMTKDLVYGSTYPNSTFDLIRSEGNTGTVVWLHGGSHIEGDKASEDNSFQLFDNVLKEGWSVVSVNYALAPEYAYPVPLRQMDELLRYLETNAEELSLPLDRVLFAGTGAGAEIIVQYVTASLYEEYRTKTGFVPEGKIQPCGLYLVSGLYTPADGGDTGLFLSDYTAFQQLRTYYGKRDPVLNQTALNADVMPYIQKGFPKVLLGEGNTGTYTKQAHQMKEVLEKADALYEALIFDEDKDNKNLIYMSFDTGYSHYASAMHGRLITFLRELAD